MERAIVEIDFANLTDDMKAALKQNLAAIGTAAGVVAIDPSKPLDRALMEQLKVHQKIAGEEKEMSIWDTAQQAAKAGGAEKAHRERAELEKKVAGYEKFKTAVAAGQMPDDESLELVAGTLGVTKQALAAGLTGEGEPEPKGKGKAAAPAAADNLSEDQIAAIVEKRFGKRLAPTEYHIQSLAEDMQAKADKLLNDEIGKALKANPKLAQLAKDAASDKNKQSILDTVTRMMTSTVDTKARGRIDQIAKAGTGDILEEIPGIVRDVVDKINPSDILAKAAPQPIVFGASEPGDLPVTILSSEQPRQNLSTDDPDFLNNETKLLGKMLSERMMAKTG